MLFMAYKKLFDWLMTGTFAADAIATGQKMSWALTLRG